MSNRRREDAAMIFTFRSGSDPNRTYETLLFSDCYMSCNCKGWVFKKSCTHTGRFSMADRQALIARKVGPGSAARAVGAISSVSIGNNFPDDTDRRQYVFQFGKYDRTLENGPGPEFLFRVAMNGFMECGCQVFKSEESTGRRWCIHCETMAELMLRGKLTDEPTRNVALIGIREIEEKIYLRFRSSEYKLRGCFVALDDGRDSFIMKSGVPMRYPVFEAKQDGSWEVRQGDKIGINQPKFVEIKRPLLRMPAPTTIAIAAKPKKTKAAPPAKKKEVKGAFIIGEVRRKITFDD
jgi:hypothetical protein